MRHRSTALVVGVTTIASVLLAACSSSGTGQNAAPGNSVLIGVEGPMTGPQASTGIDMWRGAELMAASVNASGGVLGKQVRLVQLDDKAKPGSAVATANRGIAEHIAAVIGPYNSAVGVKNLPVYRRAHVVIVRLTSNQKTNGMGITLQPMDYQVAPFMASAIEKTGGRHVAIVYDTSTYTAGVADQVKTLLGTAGVPVVAFEPISSTDTQFTEVLNKVKAASPNLVYFVAYDPQAEDLVKQASTLGVPGTCLVDGLAAQGPTFLSTVPLALNEKCVFSGVPTAVQFPDAGAYVSAYQAKYHQEPGTWGVFAYDSLGLLVDQAKSVGSLAEAKLDPALFHASGYRGATGITTIDPQTGNRVDPPLVMQIVDSSGHYVVSPDYTAKGALPDLGNL